MGYWLNWEFPDVFLGYIYTHGSYLHRSALDFHAIYVVLNKFFTTTFADPIAHSPAFVYRNWLYLKWITYIQTEG